MVKQDSIILSGGTPPIPANELLYGLVSHWSLEETSLGVVYDDLGNNDGVRTGCTIDQPGPISRSYYFDGVGDFINLDVYSHSGSGISYFARVKLDDVTDNRMIISKGDLTGIDEAFYLQINQTTGYLEARIWYSSVDYVTLTDNVNLATNSWHTVGFTFDGQIASLYRNGNLVVRTFIDGGGLGDDSQAAFIGRSGDAGDRRWFKGYISEVGYWERRLMTEDVSDFYNTTRGIAFADFQDISSEGTNDLLKGLLASYPMTDTTGVMLDEHTGNIPGYFVNCTRSGSEYTFNGSSQYVQILDIDPLTFLDETFSITVQFKTAATGGWTFYKGSNSGNREWAISITTTGLQIGIYNNGTSTGANFLNLGNYADNNWHTVTFTCSFNTLTGYVDGSYISELSLTANIGNYNSDIHIGRYGGGSLYWAGSLRDFRMHTRALNLAEVQLLHNGGSSYSYSNFELIRDTLGTTLYNNLIFAYDFEEPSGTTLYDGSEYGEDATIIGTDPELGQIGVEGNAIVFSQNDDEGYIRVNPSTSKYNWINTRTTQWSFSCFLKLEESVAFLNRYILATTADTGFGMTGISIYLQLFAPFYRFRIALGNNTGMSTVYDSFNTYLFYEDFLLSNYHLLAITYDTNYLKIYINGILIGTMSAGGPYGTANPPQPLCLGGFPTYDASKFFMDQVRFYKHRVLTETEILRLYNEGNGISIENLRT